MSRHSQFGGWPIRENADGSRQRFVEGEWVPMLAEWAQSGKRLPSERPRDNDVFLTAARIIL